MIIFLSLLSLVIKAELISDNTYQKLLLESKLIKNEQAFCYRLPGEEIKGFNLEDKKTPASISKLFTTFVGLKRWGADHKFKTTFFQIGDKLMIKGAMAPYFLEEDLWYAFWYLRNNKINEITFDENFLFAEEIEKTLIAQKIQKALDYKTWDENLKKKFSWFQNDLKKINIEIESESFIQAPSKINFLASQDIPAVLKPILIEESAPLSYYVKFMNQVSQNRLARALFTGLGANAQNFNLFLQNHFGWSFEETWFAEGSGGRRNFTSCENILKLLLDFSQEYSMENILNVAALEGGTLRNRFMEEAYRGAVLGKTGTLPEPDFTFSTLAGVAKTKKGDIHFAILNQSKTVSLQDLKLFQEKVVKLLIDLSGGKKSLEDYPGFVFTPLHQIKMYTQF